MDVYVGTCGYSYQHWKGGVFYPRGLPQRAWLEFYARHFNTLELNVTFYRLPEESTFRRWDEQTPSDFTFAVKGPRFITHIKRLKEPKDPLVKLRDNVLPLAAKVKCFLWQLPPGFKKDGARLGAFCEQVAKTKVLNQFVHAFEFREESWFCPEIYSVLKEFRFCLCLADSPARMGQDVLTADFTYARFHGGSALYSSEYSQAELKNWAAKIKRWEKRLKGVYAYFNNDACGYAVTNALRFREMLLAAVMNRKNAGP